MHPDTVEMTYAMYTELENERWARFERALGVTWTYEDAVKVQSKPPEGEDAAAPTLIGPGGKVFYPLAVALNPQLMPEIRKRFHTGLANAFGDEGITGDTQSLFNLPKDQFKRLVGEAGTDVDELNVQKDQVRYVPKKG